MKYEVCGTATVACAIVVDDVDTEEAAIKKAKEIFGPLTNIKLTQGTTGVGPINGNNGKAVYITNNEINFNEAQPLRSAEEGGPKTIF